MLVSEAITNAYRESNIIVLGAQPTTTEFSEALSLLNDFRRTLLGYEFGEALEDWPIPPAPNRGAPDGLISPDLSANFFLVPVQNSRMLTKLTATSIVKFPENPDDGARMALVDVGSSVVNLTLDGNGRLIEGQTALTDTVSQFFNRYWFYRGDLASWERVRDLTLNDALPLPDDFNDLFITYLAIRLAPRNSQTASPDTRVAFASVLARAKARYRQKRPTGVTLRGEYRGDHSYGDSAWFE